MKSILTPTHWGKKWKWKGEINGQTSYNQFTFSINTKYVFNGNGHEDRQITRQMDRQAKLIRDVYDKNVW